MKAIEMATKKNAKIGAVVLEFIGSLVFLYIVFSWIGSGGTPAWLSGAGGLWLPIVGSLALISSIILFLLSVVALSGRSEDMITRAAYTATWWGGFAIFILTAGSTWFWLGIIGFLLAYIGVGWQKM